MQLSGICKFSRKFAHAVVSQWEDIEARAATQFFGHAAQTVAVYIQIGQFLKLAQRVREWLTGRQKTTFNTGAEYEWTKRCVFILTCNRFSVRTSSVRFSHSPIESVRWVNLFWSTFKMDSCFRQPEHRHIHTNMRYKTAEIKHKHKACWTFLKQNTFI